MSEELPELELGAEYTIRHNRKGTLNGVVQKVYDDWVVVEIEGEEVTIRRSFCRFKKVENL